MKKGSKLLACIVVVALMFSFIAMPAQAKSKNSSTHVSSYTKKSGTHVKTYKRTTRDNTYKNNYSYKGNYNPHTGKYGTKTYRKK